MQTAWHDLCQQIVRSPHKSSEPPFELVMSIRVSLQLQHETSCKDSRKTEKTTGNTKKRPAATLATSDSDTDGSNNDEDNDGGSFESASPPPQKKQKGKPAQVMKKPVAVLKRPAQQTPSACCMSQESSRNRFIVRIAGEPSRLFTYGVDGKTKASKKKALAYIRNFFVERGWTVPPRFAS